MFVIQKQDDGYYFHEKGKIILFETPQEAQNYLRAFQQYATSRLLQEKGPQGIFELQFVIANLRILKQNFIDTPECGVVLFKDLDNERL